MFLIMLFYGQDTSEAYVLRQYFWNRIFYYLTILQIFPSNHLRLWDLISII